MKPGLIGPCSANKSLSKISISSLEPTEAETWASLRPKLSSTMSGDDDRGRFSMEVVSVHGVEGGVSSSNLASIVSTCRALTPSRPMRSSLSNAVSCSFLARTLYDVSDAEQAYCSYSRSTLLGDLAVAARKRIRRPASRSWSSGALYPSILSLAIVSRHSRSTRSSWELQSWDGIG